MNLYCTIRAILLVALSVVAANLAVALSIIFFGWVRDKIYLAGEKKRRRQQNDRDHL